MKQLLCLVSGGHKPLRNALSTNRIFCSRCGIELEYISPEDPMKRDEIPTTVKRVRLSRIR